MTAATTTVGRRLRASGIIMETTAVVAVATIVARLRDTTIAVMMIVGLLRRAMMTAGKLLVQPPVHLLARTLLYSAFSHPLSLPPLLAARIRDTEPAADYNSRRDWATTRQQMGQDAICCGSKQDIVGRVVRFDWVLCDTGIRRWCTAATSQTARIQASAWMWTPSRW